MKLGKRLAAIAAQVTGQYSSIWDCCCDHGFLGMKLLADEKAETVHFVDCIPSITDNLSARLLSQHSAETNYQVHCIDVLDLPFDAEYSQHPHLIIIAGVGGEFALQIIQHLISKYSHLKLEFLLCPVRHQYLLRQSLQCEDLVLIDETLVEENKRFYEIIHLANYSLGSSNSPLKASGSMLWQPFSPVHRRYLEKQLNHWQLALRNTEEGSEARRLITATLEDYQLIANSFLVD